jgi:C-terminal processing protease CtpA/Prc
MDRVLKAKFQEELEKGFRNSKGILIDLRGVNIDPDVVETIDFLHESLISAKTSIPAERTLVHFGYPPQSGGSSGSYKEAFVVAAPRSFPPNKVPISKPVAILVSQQSPVPAFALALQTLGQGQIIAENGLSDAGTVSRDTVDLGEGLVANVRIGELISSTGSGGIHADQIVPGNNPPGEEISRKVAMDWLLQGKRPVANTTQVVLPASPTNRIDQTYPDSPYPDPELRLLGLFRLWNVIHYFFPYKHLMDRDWDSSLSEFIPKFDQAKDEGEYTLAIAEMVALTQDSHVVVRNNPWFERFIGQAAPPIRVRMIEGLPVVTQLLSKGPAKPGDLIEGDTILSVDGRPAQDRMARLKPFLPSSTTQWQDHLLTTYLLRGDDQSEVEILAVDAENHKKTVRFTRGKEFAPPAHFKGGRTGEVFKVLPGNIGYVDLDRLRIHEVDSMFERLKGTMGIIFDMRGYPNATAWTLGPRLNVNHARLTARINQPTVQGGDTKRDRVTRDFYTTLSGLADETLYRGKSIMLMDERAVSQAEFTGQILKAVNGTVFVGSPTCGANGDVTRLTLPGGTIISFTGQSITHADGRQLQRVGLVPDILAKPSITGIRQGRDEVLERAILFLTQGN